jgi:release factor glutamine methyltransferase
MKERLIRVAYQTAASFLHHHGIASPEFEAEWLLRRLLNVDRTQFFMMWDENLTAEQSAQLERWLKRRSEGEPLQYLFGSQEFYGREFIVTPDVLIPRPETELLVEEVCQQINIIFGKQPLHLVDVGTGSGAIAITLALECPQLRVTAIDLSIPALQIAEENAKRLGVSKQIQFVHGDYLTPLLQNKSKVDVLVSNPPYIPTETIPQLEKQVRQYEPRLALDGGSDGLDPYRVLTEQVKELSEKPKLVAFEIGYDQGEEVEKLVRKIDEQITVWVKKDWQGHDRMVFGRL